MDMRPIDVDYEVVRPAKTYASRMNAYDVERILNFIFGMAMFGVAAYGFHLIMEQIFLSLR
jgi:hypothetical protein